MAAVMPNGSGGRVGASLCRLEVSYGGCGPPPIRARTRFFDDQVMEAISAGISQVVVCGGDIASATRRPSLTQLVTAVSGPGD